MKLVVIILNDVRMIIQWNPSPGSPRRNRKSVEQWIALLFEKFEKVRVPIFEFFVSSHTNRSSMATWTALLFEQFEKVRLPTPKFFVFSRTKRSSMVTWTSLLFENFEKVRLSFFKSLLVSHTNRTSLLFEKAGSVVRPATLIFVNFSHRVFQWSDTQTCLLPFSVFSSVSGVFVNK